MNERTRVRDEALLVNQMLTEGMIAPGPQARIVQDGGVCKVRPAHPAARRDRHDGGADRRLRESAPRAAAHLRRRYVFVLCLVCMSAAEWVTALAALSYATAQLLLLCMCARRGRRHARSASKSEAIDHQRHKENTGMKHECCVQVGYVMSGSRHSRMNAIRMRKENQVRLRAREFMRAVNATCALRTAHVCRPAKVVTKARRCMRTALRLQACFGAGQACPAVGRNVTHPPGTTVAALPPSLACASGPGSARCIARHSSAAGHKCLERTHRHTGGDGRGARPARQDVGSRARAREVAKRWVGGAGVHRGREGGAGADAGGRGEEEGGPAYRGYAGPCGRGGRRCRARRGRARRQLSRRARRLGSLARMLAHMQGLGAAAAVGGAGHAAGEPTGS